MFGRFGISFGRRNGIFSPVSQRPRTLGRKPFTSAGGSEVPIHDTTIAKFDLDFGLAAGGATYWAIAFADSDGKPSALGAVGGGLVGSVFTPYAPVLLARVVVPVLVGLLLGDAWNRIPVRPSDLWKRFQDYRSPPSEDAPTTEEPPNMK